MIKANELRLGNLLQHANENGIFEFDIIEILAKGVNVIHNNGIWFIKYEDLNQIPLTEEWLLKRNININDLECLGVFGIGKNKKGNFCLLYMTDHCKTLFEGIEFLYVHEMQNFYYDLKKEELKLKDTVKS